MDKLSNRLKASAALEAVRLSAPSRKRARIVKKRQERPVGVASTEKSSRPPKRIAGRGRVNATVPEQKRARIVAE